MTSSTASDAADVADVSEARDTAGWARFDRTTSRWGRITMLAGLVLSLAGPVWLVYFSGLDVDPGRVWIAFLAIAAAVGFVWVIEPFAYFPILGPAAMYQAFMIGNIGNKLLPAAVAAQNRLDAKPGTKKADLVAILAICGAALIHVVSLVVFVGLLGTVLLHVLPDAFLTAVSTYIFPAIIGGFVVQMLMNIRSHTRVLLIAAIVAVGVLVLSIVAPAVGSLGLVIGVILTVGIAWITRSRASVEPAGGDTIDDVA